MGNQIEQIKNAIDTFEVPESIRAFTKSIQTLYKEGKLETFHEAKNKSLNKKWRKRWIYPSAAAVLTACISWLGFSYDGGGIGTGTIFRNGI